MQKQETAGLTAKKHDLLDDIAIDFLSFRERDDYFKARTAGNPQGAMTILAIATANAYERIPPEKSALIFASIGISLEKARALSKNTTI